jgi:ADP-ribose pyrophosphatase
MKKIPDNAIKVFEGIMFDVYQWEQELFDGTTATFEALKRQASVTIIAEVDGKILFNNEEQPGKPAFSALPGGRVEKDDTPLSAAQRELLEETGYESSDWTEWFTADAGNMSKLEWNSHYFIARDCKKIKEPKLDAGEKVEAVFLTFEELLEKRRGMTNRSVALEEKFENAVINEEEKQKLKELLGIKTSNKT